MSLLVLFAVLVKATFLSFSGFGSLPVLRDELIVNRRVLTDDDLNRAVAVARVTPGPMGSYVVAAGYAAAGWRGAVAGWIAMSAPALCVVPLFVFLRNRSHTQRWRSAIDAMILASSGLVLVTAAALIPTAITSAGLAIVSVAALVVVLFTGVPTVWVIAAGAAAVAAWP